MLWHLSPTPKFCFGITTSLIRVFDTVVLLYTALLPNTRSAEHFTFYLSKLLDPNPTTALALVSERMLHNSLSTLQPIFSRKAYDEPQYIHAVRICASRKPLQADGGDFSGFYSGLASPHIHHQHVKAILAHHRRSQKGPNQRKNPNRMAAS
jgi:hypothetical protein